MELAAIISKHGETKQGTQFPMFYKPPQVQTFVPNICTDVEPILNDLYCNDDIINDKIGNIDVKRSSSSVYFHVQRKTSSYKNTYTPLTYQIANLNIGGAMDITSGIFTAPTSGVYYFSFIAVSLTDDTNVIILLKNGKYVATSLVLSINYNPSLSATL